MRIRRSGAPDSSGAPFVTPTFISHSVSILADDQLWSTSGYYWLHNGYHLASWKNSVRNANRPVRHSFAPRSCPKDAESLAAGQDFKLL